MAAAEAVQERDDTIDRQEIPGGDAEMRSIFDDISWYCDARSKGVEYANMAEKVRELERNPPCNTSSMTITFCPVKHYPVRSHGRRVR